MNMAENQQVEQSNLNSNNLKKRGSKEEVYNGLAIQTGGGLRKADLILNKRGQVVSKKRSEQGAKQFKNIEKYIKDKKEKKSLDKESEQPEEAEQPPIEQQPSIEYKKDAASLDKQVQVPAPELLKKEAVQEEKSKEAEIPALNPKVKEIKARKPRKVKDSNPLIDDIKTNQV